MHHELGKEDCLATESARRAQLCLPLLIDRIGQKLSLQMRRYFLTSPLS
jgi:hypothetical protein